MDIHFQGEVTDINLKYCKFVLDKKKVVHAGYLFTNCNEIKIPILKSWVILTGCEVYENILFLKPTSKIFCDKHVSKENAKQCEPFLKLIREHNLNFLDMLHLENTVENFDISKIFPTDFLTKHRIKQAAQVKDLIFKIIPFISPKIKYNTLLDNSELATYKILSPRDHKLEEGAKELKCNIYWSHGVQSFQNKVCLIGILRVSPGLGFIILEDAIYFIVCQIAPDIRGEYSAKLSTLLNNFVLIKNYHIFLERTTDNIMIHYIFVNIRDIQLLLSICANNELESKAHSSKAQIMTVNLKVIHRCTVTIKNNYLNCWVQCGVKTPNSNVFKECFFILHSQHFLKYPLMNPDDEYILSSTFKSFAEEMTTFKSKKNYTVNFVSLPVFWIPNDATLTLITRVKNRSVSAILQDFSFMSVPETREVLDFNKRKYEEDKLANRRTTSNLLTFEAVIKKRRTVSPSRNAPKPVSHTCFGVRGTQVHQITFKPLNQEEVTREHVNNLERQQTQLKVYEGKNLKEAERIYQENIHAKPPLEETTPLYMHNWQELLLPLGLVHGMKVAVRNVINPKGSKYLKPTFLTRIEPIAYEPEQQFETAFEFVNNKDWGSSFPLSASHCIPTNSVCWAPALTLHFTAFSIYMRCPTCKEKYAPGQQRCCFKGPEEGLISDILLAVRGRDKQGVFDAVSREEKVLRMLLGMNEKQWRLWKRAFKLMKWWTMKPQEWEDQQESNPFVFRSEGEDIIAEALTNKIVSFNKQASHRFDIKCRKLEKNSKDFNLNQKWYIIDIRPSSNPEEPYDILYLS